MMPWLKLVRRGNTFAGYASADGKSWIKIGQQISHVGARITVGLAMTGGNPAIESAAAFSNVQISR